MFVATFHRHSIIRQNKWNLAHRVLSRIWVITNSSSLCPVVQRLPYTGSIHNHKATEVMAAWESCTCFRSFPVIFETPRIFPAKTRPQDLCRGIPNNSILQKAKACFILVLRTIATSGSSRTPPDKKEITLQALILKFFSMTVNVEVQIGLRSTRLNIVFTRRRPKTNAGSIHSQL